VVERSENHRYTDGELTILKGSQQAMIEISQPKQVLLKK
jgi:hypothetical protein